MDETVKKIKIVYAEDSRSIASVVKQTLVTAGFDVIYFSNGDGVVEEIVKVRPQAILLDNNMPIKDGFTILKEIKAIPDVKDIPVIFFTTINDKTKIIERLGNGAADYVIKDSRAISDIVNRIKKVLSKPA